MSTPQPSGSLLPPLLFFVLAGAASLLALPQPPAEPPSALPEGPAMTFHAAVEESDDLEGTAFCAGCHALPPHEGEGVAAAFYNEHASFVECLVCHWARRSGEAPDASWRKGEEGFMSLGLDPGGAPPAEAPVLREKLLPKQPCFDRGLSCTSCHSRGAMEPYLRPGLSPQTQAALESLPEIFTLSSGTKWYFPQRQ